MTLKLSPLRSIGVSILAYTILCSTLPVLPSKTVRSNYAIRPCSITSAPNIPQKWEDHNPRLSSTLKEGIPVLPIDFSPRTSYIEQAWIVFHLEVQSLKIDDGSSDTCSALRGLSPLKVFPLPFCRVDFWQYELQVDRSGTLSPGNVSSSEYLFRNMLGAGKDVLTIDSFFVSLSCSPRYCFSKLYVEPRTLIAETWLSPRALVRVPGTTINLRSTKSYA